MPLPTAPAPAPSSDSLSQHAAHLSASLARRRADLALLRAEAATVALSLESAKQRLDLALRDETLIHATTAAAAAAAPSSPRASYIQHHAHHAPANPATAPPAPSPAHTASAPDPASADSAKTDRAPASVPDPHDPATAHERAALARSLAAQLDVSQTTLRDATRRRDALRDELTRLQSAAATATAHAAATGSAASARAAEQPLNASGVGRSDTAATAASLARDAGTARTLTANYTPPDLQLPAPPRALPHGDKQPRPRNALAAAPASPTSPADPILSALRDAVTTDTSFRADHARIWRDATMPNLVLVSPDGTAAAGQQQQQQQQPAAAAAGGDDEEPTDPGVALGVVTERIFEGVTCFTPTDAPESTPTAAASAPPADLRIASHGPVASPDPSVAPRVTRHFAALTAPASHPATADPKLIAPRTALTRALNLIRDPDGSASRRRKWRTRLTSKKSASADTGGDDAADAVTVASNGAARTGSGELATAATTEKAGGDEPDVPAVVAPPPTPRLPVPKLSHKSAVLTGPQFAAIVADGVPIRFHDSKLSLLYSTERDGMSLRTLYSRVHAASPTLIAIRDTRGRVFGCYGAQPWKSSATRYYGSGESFVFGTTTPFRDDDDDDDDNNVDGGKDPMKEQESVRVYKWSRDNSFFQFTSGTFLAIGGGAGSHFALWIDEDLLMGTTSACSTFASPPLIDLTSEDESESLEFKILVVEVWGFGVRALS